MLACKVFVFQVALFTLNYVKGRVIAEPCIDFIVSARYKTMDFKSRTFRCYSCFLLPKGEGAPEGWMRGSLYDSHPNPLPEGEGILLAFQ
jgi:hypothetical protein